GEVVGMSSDVILPGDRFAGPNNSIWRVVDPWLPIEDAGEFAPCVWIICERMDTDRWIPVEKFDCWVARGRFRPLCRRDDHRQRQRHRCRRDRGRAEVDRERERERDKRVSALQVPDGETVIYRPGEPALETEAWLAGPGVDP